MHFKKLFFFQLLMLLLAGHSFAMPLALTDTIKHKINPKQAALFEKYGTDEVSTAIINNYFSKRKANKWVMGISLVMGAVSGVGYHQANTTATDGNGYGNLFLAIISIFGLLTAGTLFLIGLLPLVLSGQKSLIKVLEKYKATGHLPKKYRRFKKLAAPPSK